MHTGNISEPLPFEVIRKAALYKDDRFHVMLLHIPEGEELKPHSSKTDAFCIVQKGEADFYVEGERFHLRKGDLFSFKAKQEHSVKAISDFSMLLIK